MFRCPKCQSLSTRIKRTWWMRILGLIGKCGRYECHNCGHVFFTFR